MDLSLRKLWWRNNLKKNLKKRMRIAAVMRMLKNYLLIAVKKVVNKNRSQRKTALVVGRKNPNLLRKKTAAAMMTSKNFSQTAVMILHISNLLNQLLQ